MAAPRSIGNFGVTINVDKKPFDDERVRLALTLALDRRYGQNAGPADQPGHVGGLMHPDSKWALSPEELEQMPGFSRNHEANLREAKRLLAEPAIRTASRRC